MYIRHRDHEDIAHLANKSRQLVEEMEQIAEELPLYKLIFLTPLVKDALLQFSTYICALLNQIDAAAPSLQDSLVYTMPILLIDIPFEVLRALKRSNQNLYDHKSD